MNRRKLHEQARRAIERLIADREIKAGSRIPSESKLAGELYVSRTTIRRALKDLEEEGKIEHEPGGAISPASPWRPRRGSRRAPGIPVGGRRPADTDGVPAARISGGARGPAGNASPDPRCGLGCRV